MKQGEAELPTLQYWRDEAELRILKLTSVFHHLPSVGPKQLCTLVPLECIRKVGKYFTISNLFSNSPIQIISKMMQ